MSRLMPPVMLAVLFGHGVPSAAADAITTLSPPCGSVVPAPITLIADNPARTALDYRFDVYSDPALTIPVATVSVPQGAGSITSAPVAPTSPPVWFADTTYYWRVVVPGVMQSGSCDFRVSNGNRPPPAPQLAGPLGAPVPTTMPMLTVHNVVEPDGDAVRYAFEVYSDPALSNRVASSGGCVVAEGPGGHTAWTTLPLSEDHLYYWRARACDVHGQLGPWSGTGELAVNEVNQPPTPPTLVSPTALSIVDRLRPSLALLTGDDPEPEPVVYGWHLALDPTFSTVIADGFGGAAGGGQLLTFTVPVDLAEDHRYCWRAWADDGQATSTSGIACFLVSTANDPPTVPVLRAPSDQQRVTTTAPAYSWQASTDPEGDAVTYELEVRDADDALVGAVGGVSGTVTAIASELTNRGHYAWRVRALDAQGAASAWSSTAGFVVDDPTSDPAVTANGGGCSAGDLPAAPVAALFALGLVARRRRTVRPAPR